MNNRVIPVAGLLVLLLILVIGWFAVVQPQSNDVSNLKAQIASTRQQIAEVTAETAAGKASVKNVRTAKKDLRQLGAAFPRSYAEPQLIDTIQSQARGADVDFQTISFTAPSSTSAGTANPGASTRSTNGTTSTAASPSATATVSSTDGAIPLGFTLTVDGNYFDVTKFVARLQDMTGATTRRIWSAGRMIAFTDLSMTSSKTAAGTVTATVSGNAYLRPGSASTNGAS